MSRLLRTPEGWATIIAIIFIITILIAAVVGWWLLPPSFLETYGGP